MFGLCHLLGYRFAPRIKDLKDRKLYTIDKPGAYPLLEPLIGDTVETAAIASQWGELLRLKASIQAGESSRPSSCASLPRRAAATPCRAPCGRLDGSNDAVHLRWLSDPDLRQRSHAGLNKGEASNSLRRAIFFHRQGEFETARSRTSASVPRASVSSPPPSFIGTRSTSTAPSSICALRA